MNFRSLCLLLLLLSGSARAAGDALVVIGHAALPKTDRQTLQRLYTGRIVSIGQHAVAPINLPPGNPLRDEFLQWVMGQNEEQYTGYWLVRRYVGKGSPPLELESVDALVKRVATTPGAVAYLPLSKVPPGGNVIFKR